MMRINNREPLQSTSEAEKMLLADLQSLYQQTQISPETRFAWQRGLNQEEQPMKMKILKRIAAAMAVLAVLVVSGLASVDVLQNRLNRTETSNFGAQKSADGIAYDMMAPAPEAAAYRKGADSSAKALPDRQADLVIYRYHMSLSTLSFDETLKKIQQLIEGFEGYVQEATVYDAAYARKRADYIVRIPADKLEQSVEALKGLAKLHKLSKTQEVVTQMHQDLTIQLESKRVFLHRLQEMVKEAKNIEEMLQVETQLQSVTQDITLIERSLKDVNQRVAYATLSFELAEDKLQEQTGNDHSFGQRIRSALQLAGESFVEVIMFLIVFIARIIPWILLVGIIVIVFKAIKKRRK